MVISGGRAHSGPAQSGSSTGVTKLQTCKCAYNNSTIKKARLQFFVFLNKKKPPKCRVLIHIRKAKSRIRIYVTVELPKQVK